MLKLQGEKILRNQYGSCSVEMGKTPTGNSSPILIRLVASPIKGKKTKTNKKNNPRNYEGQKVEAELKLKTVKT